MRVNTYTHTKNLGLFDLAGDMFVWLACVLSFICESLLLQKSLLSLSFHFILFHILPFFCVLGFGFKSSVQQNSIWYLSISFLENFPTCVLFDSLYSLGSFSLSFSILLFFVLSFNLSSSLIFLKSHFDVSAADFWLCLSESLHFTHSTHTNLAQLAKAHRRTSVTTSNNRQSNNLGKGNKSCMHTHKRAQLFFFCAVIRLGTLEPV